MRLLDDQGKLFGRISLIDLGAVLILLLLAAPVIRFNYRIFVLTPRITRVESEEITITADQDAFLTLHGKRFDPGSVVRLVDTPLITVSATSRRIDLRIPTRQIYPGAYTLTVTNPRGLSTKWIRPVQLNSLPPKINEVQILPSSKGRELKILILGKNFQERSSVQIDTWGLNIAHVSSGRLEAFGDYPSGMLPGKYPIRVVNYYGQFDQMENALTLSPLVQTVPVAPNKPVHLDFRKAIPVRILCVFYEPESTVKRKLIKRGAVTYKDDNTRPVAKIIKILSKSPMPKSDRHLILAEVLLACSLNSEGDFLYEREKIAVGRSLPFQFQSLDITGTVMTDPVSLGGDWRDYVE